MRCGAERGIAARGTIRRTRLRRGAGGLLAALAVVVVVAPPARAIEAFDGRIQAHGAISQEFRAISNGFRMRKDTWFLSKMATKLSVEIEAEILPNGWGPIDIMEGFVRVDVQHDCVFDRACYMAKTWDYFGDDAGHWPSNLADGRSSGLTGVLPNPLKPVARVQPDRRLLTFAEVPPADTLLALGNPAALQNTFGPLLDANFSTSYIRGAISPQILGMGPINPGFFIDSTGSLADRPSRTPGRPLRPATSSLFTPTHALNQERPEYGSFDQNFTEWELQWNRGASQQQTKELKEAYLDLTFMDGRLVLRLGKQITRWGKTELFRSVDQFNPQDLAISNLPSFEESLIGLWQARAIYSFYTVGPFEDLRLELVANLDHVEPADLGDCGEPYTVFLVCQKSQGLFAHGFAQLGLAGEKRAEKWYDDFDGLELGLRVEFRVGRFSLAITDFYGYSDLPTPDYFSEYERRVDPRTGQPLDLRSQVMDPDTSDPADILRFHTGNRQLFDVVCSATLGFEIEGSFGAAIGDALDNVCAIALFGEPTEIIGGIPDLTIPLLAGLAISGDPNWNVIANLICAAIGEAAGCFPTTTQLSEDPNDDYLGSLAIGLNDGGLSEVLTIEQEALFGCGPFYYGADDGRQFAIDTGVPNSISPYDGSCNRLGLDLFNAEASVIFQRFVHNESGGIPGEIPVATRFIPGLGVVTLPGARSPFTFFDDPLGYRYDPAVDGCVADLDWIYGPGSPNPGLDPNDIPNKGFCDAFPGIDLLDGFGALLRTLGAADIAEIEQRFPNETAIASENFLKILVAVAQLTDPGSDCDYGPFDGLGVAELITECEFVNALFGAAGAQRPELRAGGNGRFGRRDFAWLSGSQIQLFYERRNVFGVAVDFAEDRTQTTWSAELVWFEDEAFINTRKENGYSTEDVLDLVISVDRPTFVNFVNANRTVFFNAQFFLRYMPNYRRLDTFAVDGPASLLATLTAFTGFWQDRLLTFITFVHEVESNSGGQIFTMTYRYSENFSTTIGLTSFYGAPSRARLPDRLPVVQFHPGDYTQRSNFRGVSAIAERDEIFVNIRYTF